MTRPRARLVLAASRRSAARRPSAGPAASTHFCLEPPLSVCQSGRMTSPQKIARLAIALDEVKPPVRRRVEVQLAVRLDQLHRIIQIVMGWESYHLYEFRVGRDVVYGISYRDRDFPGTSPLSAKKATLADILAQARNNSFRYVYDIGDDWRHTVKLEAVVDAEPEATYPRLLSAQGRCPPEDVGGTWGYAQYLEAMADPKHDRHAEMVDWRGPDFDPNTVDEANIRKALLSFAKRSQRKLKNTSGS